MIHSFLLFLQDAPPDLVNLLIGALTAVAGTLVTVFWYYQKQLQASREESLKILRDCNAETQKLYDKTHEVLLLAARQNEAMVTALQSLRETLNLRGEIEKAVARRGRDET